MDKNMDINVIESIKAQKEMIVDMLRVNGNKGVTTKQFKSKNIHHTDRISKLRKDGYVIDCEKIDSFNYRYYLVSEPTTKEKHLTSIEIFIKGWNSVYPHNPIGEDECKQVLESLGLNIVTKKSGFKKAI